MPKKTIQIPPYLPKKYIYLVLINSIFVAHFVRILLLETIENDLRGSSIKMSRVCAENLLIVLHLKRAHLSGRPMHFQILTHILCLLMMYTFISRIYILVKNTIHFNGLHLFARNYMKLLCHFRTVCCDLQKELIK